MFQGPQRCERRSGRTWETRAQGKKPVSFRDESMFVNRRQAITDVRNVNINGISENGFKLTLRCINGTQNRKSPSTCHTILHQRTIMHDLNVKKEFSVPLRQVLYCMRRSISWGSDGAGLCVMPLTPCNARGMIYLKWCSNAATLSPKCVCALYKWKWAWAYLLLSPS